jgi:hypothetical protein
LELKIRLFFCQKEMLIETRNWPFIAFQSGKRFKSGLIKFILFRAPEKLTILTLAKVQECVNGFKVPENFPVNVGFWLIQLFYLIFLKNK